MRQFGKVDIPQEAFIAGAEDGGVRRRVVRDETVFDSALAPFGFPRAKLDVEQRPNRRNLYAETHAEPTNNGHPRAAGGGCSRAAGQQKEIAAAASGRYSFSTLLASACGMAGTASISASAKNGSAMAKRSAEKAMELGGS